MGLFSTRNSDGASGLAESISSIPAKEWRKLQREADRHSSTNVGELISAPSVHPKSPKSGYPAERAGEN